MMEQTILLATCGAVAFFFLLPLLAVTSGWLWRAARQSLGAEPAVFDVTSVWSRRFDTGDTLLVAAHGLGLFTTTRVRRVNQRVANFAAEKVGADCDVLLLRYPGVLLSDADPDTIAKQMRILVEDAVDSSGKDYARIILFSHSLGSLLVRKAYLLDRRKGASGRWWAKVERIINASGVNGGWDRKRTLYSVLIASLGDYLHRGMLGLKAERGAPFTENLRTDWIRACRENEAPMPTLIQLRATIDHIIDDRNDTDVRATPCFYAITVEFSGHASLVDIGDDTAAMREPWRTRRKAIALSVSASREALDQTDGLKTFQPTERQAQARDIVFVVHGIRDSAEWGQKFVQEFDTNTGPDFVVLTPRSNRVSAYTLMFGRRDQNVRWFANHYIEALATHPNAERVHFIGHSYGTYVLTAALDRYEALRFDRVFLAGSVLPRDFKWKTYLDEPGLKRKVAEVFNVCADSDWVVALFPAMYDWLRTKVSILRNVQYLNIGDAGFYAFDEQMKQLRWLKGDHGAFTATQEAVGLATQFIRGDVNMRLPATAPWLSPKKQSTLAFLNTVIPVVWLVGVAILALIATAIGYGLQQSLMPDDHILPYVLGAIGAWLLLAAATSTL